MCYNMGKLDRGIRAVIGIGLMGFGVMVESWWGALGLIPFVTATLGWCPFYPMIGVNTGCDEDDEPID